MELTWIVVLASLCSLASPSAASGRWDESSSRLDDFSDISPDDNEPAADLSHMSDDEFLAGGAAEDAVRRPGELPASSASSDKSALMLRVLGAALKRPGMTQRFGQVLPILRVMSPPQRLALTALIMQQVMVPKDVPDSPLEMAMRLGATPDGRSNLTSELLLPLSADIAHIFRGAGLEAPEGASRPGAQGRSAGGVPGHQFRPPHPLPPAQMPPPRRRATLAGVSPALPPPLRPASGLPPPLRPAPVAVATPDDGPQAQWPQRRYGELPPPGVNRRNANAHVPPSTDMVPPPPPGRSSSTTLRPYGPAAPLSQADRHDCSLFSDTVCASVEHYPEEAILASIQADKHTVDALLADKLPPVARSVPLEMQRRQDDDYPGENPQALDASDGADDSLLCPSIVKYARPQRARATSGQWKYIVNTAEHTQTLRLEKCSRVEEPCQYLSDKVRSHCAQVYNYHRLLTWDREQGLHMDIFKVPTCCSCQVLKSPFLTSNSVARRPNLGGLGGSQFLQHQKQQSLSQPVAEYTHTKETVVGSETGRPVLSPYKHFSQQQVDDSRRDPQPASPSKPTWPFRKPATRRPPPQLSRGQPGPPQYGLQTLEDTAAPADLLPQYPPLPLQHERDYPPLRRAASVRNRTRVSQPAKDDADVPDDLEAEGSQPVAQRRPLPVILTPAGGAVRGPTSPLLTATSKRPLSPALPPRLHRPSSSAPTSATPPTPPAAVPSSTPTTKRVNYSYHPIIDFFRPLEKQMAAQEPRRARPAAVALDEVESRTADDDAPPPGPAWSAQQSDWSPITKRSEAT